MIGQRGFHLFGARLECPQQVAVTTLKILQHVGQRRAVLLLQTLEQREPIFDLLKPLG